MSRLLRLPLSLGAALDVGLASLSNLILGLVAAAHLSLTDFGALSACLLIGIIVAGYARQLCGDPLVLRFASEQPSVRRVAGRRALGATLLYSLIAAPAAALVTWLVLLASWQDAVGAVRLAMVMAVGVPFLALQEVARNVSYCRGRVWTASGNSAARLLALVILLAVASTVESVGPEVFFGIWTLGALVGLGCGLLLLADYPAKGALRWFANHGVLGRRLVADFTLTLTSAELSMLLISMVAGADGIGAIRKSQIPLAPLTLLAMGAAVSLQPVLVRRVKNGVGPAALARFAYLVSGAVCAVGAVWCGLIWLIPTQQMETLLGEGWDQARPLLPLVTLYLLLGVITTLLGICLRALGVVGRQVRARLVIAPLTLAAVAASAQHGVFASMGVLCVSLIVVTVVWHVLVLQAEEGRGIEYG